MMRLNWGKDLYIKGRIGWKGLSKDEYLTTGEYRIINATALMDGYIDWNNCGYISKERYYESEEIMLQNGDILISKDGTLGKIGYVKNIPFKCSVASGIFVVRNLIPDKLDFDYLYHLLKSSVFKEYVNKKKTDGSTINHLYQSDLEKFVIDIPDIKEQKKISKLLNHIDKKIENNKTMNKNIDKYSRLYLDKIMSNKNIKKKVIKFGDLFESQAGYAFKSSDWKKNGDSVLTIKSLNDDILNLNNVSYINTSHGKKLEKYKVKNGNIVFAMSGNTIGKVGLVAIDLQNVYVNQRVLNILTNDNNLTFIFNIIRDESFQKIVFRLGANSAQPNISEQDLKNIMIEAPDTNTMNKYNELFKPYYKVYINNIIENYNLDNYKSFLLPQFMANKIKVED